MMSQELTQHSSKGLRDANELREAYKHEILSLRRENKAAGTEAVGGMSAPSSPFPAPPAPPPPFRETGPATSTTASSDRPLPPRGVRPLSSFIDVAKTSKLPSNEIEYIWRLRHASSPNSVCAVIPTATYNRLAATAQRHPQFILPLPRSEGEQSGAEIHFMQWTFPSEMTSTVLFTHLAEYKLRGEYSQPHTTITHHLDLAGPTGLVLLQGSVLEGRGVTADDARWLLMCLQKFYGVGDDAHSQAAAPRRKLLEQFSAGDGDFRVEELLEEAEKIS